MELLSIKIDNLNNKEVLTKIGEYLDSDSWHQIATVNPEFLVAAQNNERFKKVLNECHINVTDGFGIKIAALLTGQIPPIRFAGIDLIWDIFRICEQKNCSVLLLGGLPEVGDKAVTKILNKYTNLNISAITGGNIKYDFNSGSWWQDPEILSKIKELKPQIIMAALGHPKQELWLSDHKDNLPSVRLAIGIGGSLDFISGSVRRAPIFLRQLGLEWFFRLIQEPWRLKRIFNATFKFIYYILKYQK